MVGNDRSIRKISPAFRSKSRRSTSKKAKSEAVGSPCFIQALFTHNLEHILEGILLELPIQDFLHCRLLNRQWYSFIAINMYARNHCQRILQPEALDHLDQCWFEEYPKVVNTFNLSDVEAKYRKVHSVADATDFLMSFGSAAIRIWNRPTNAKKAIVPQYKPIKGCHFLTPAPMLAMTKTTLMVFYHHDPIAFVFDRVHGYAHIQTIDITGKKPFKAFALDPERIVFAHQSGVDVFSIKDHGVDQGTNLSIPNEGLTDITGDGNIIVMGCAADKSIRIFNARTGILMNSQHLAHCVPNVLRMKFPYIAVCDQKPNLSFYASSSAINLFHIDELDENLWFGSSALGQSKWKKYHWSFLPQSWKILDFSLSSRLMVILTGSRTDLSAPSKREVRFHIFPLPPQRMDFRARTAIHEVIGPVRRMRDPVFHLEQDSLILEVEIGKIEEWNYWMSEGEEPLKLKRRQWREKREQDRANEWKYWMRCKTQSCY